MEAGADGLRLRRLSVMIVWWAVFAVLTYAVLARVSSLLADGWDNGCPDHLIPATEPTVGGGAENEHKFLTRDRCFDTGIHLQAGEKYHIAVDVKEAEDWIDKTIPANPNGLDNWRMNWHPLMIATMPFRRHLKDSWFVLMGKIGRNGTTFKVGSGRTIRATETGRLFLYVNDAIPPFCRRGCSFGYENNVGAAKAMVWRLPE
ncbi:MAG: hypothetical protein V3R98_01025 [Alphaproteobacteria bacterium]